MAMSPVQDVHPPPHRGGKGGSNRIASVASASTGCAAARLHPWLQSSAPSGPGFTRLSAGARFSFHGLRRCAAPPVATILGRFRDPKPPAAPPARVLHFGELGKRPA